MARRPSGKVTLIAAIAAAASLAIGLISFAGAAGQGPTISVDSATTGVGLQTTVTLRAQKIAPPGLGSWSIGVSYDPALVSAVSCFAEHGGACNPAFDATSVRVSGVSLLGLSGDVPLATITFRCLAVGSGALTPSWRALSDATLGGPQPVAATAVPGTITCAAEAPATPPAAPAEPSGDVNCDDAVDGTDAALILQLDAGLVDALDCPEEADVNGDGAVDGLDAALILQSDAGLLERAEA